jgi:ABC-type multidrug transport system fused ATPase/permease subunit
MPNCGHGKAADSSMSKPGKGYYSLRSFFDYLKAYKSKLILVFVSFAISNVALALVPVYIGKLVGALSATPVQGHEAVIWVWVLIGLSSIHNLVWRGSEILYRKYILPLSYQYDTLLFRELIHYPYPYFVDKFTGKLSSYITTISQELRQFLDDIFYNYTSQFISLVATGIILTTVNWQTGLIFVVGMISMFGLGRVTISNNIKYEKVATDVQSTKNGKLVDAIANFVNVKSFRKEYAEWKTIEDEQSKVISSQKRAFLWGIVFWGAMSIIVRDLMWPATIGLNVYLFFHHQISLAGLTVVLSTILIFTNTVWDLIWVTSQFSLKLARIEEAHRYLFGPVNIFRKIRTFKNLEVQPPNFHSDLEFNELNFAYPDRPQTPVLQNISLKIKKGEKLGVVGPSGSGKSTLTKLLLGYYEVKTGILLDGKPVDVDHLAKLVSYVPQDTSLFHRTIAENIAYAADRDVNRNEILAAAKRAHAHEFITQIEGSYEALVGERGVKLSTGQRQRVAIARAFVDDRPILVLDEATSALDSESELLVQQALEELWHDKTVIAIAHRLSTLRHMDRIIVMDKGQIVEQGSHALLLERKGVYARLWTHQSGGFLEG